MASRSTVLGIWAGLLSSFSYYAKERSLAELAAQRDLWVKLLADVPDDALTGAAGQWMLIGKFFPALSELYLPALGVQRPDPDNALEAWGSVLATFEPGAVWPGKYLETTADGQVLTYGGEEPRFDDPITRRVVRALGGWFRLGQSECGMSERSQFVACYKDLQTRAHDEALLIPEMRRLKDKANQGRVDALVAGSLKAITARGSGGADAASG